MFLIAIAMFAASAACLVWGAIGMERRSKEFDDKYPVEMSTTKTYHPMPPNGLNLPLIVLLLSFGLFALGVVLIVAGPR